MLKFEEVTVGQFDFFVDGIGQFNFIRGRKDGYFGFISFYFGWFWTISFYLWIAKSYIKRSLGQLGFKVNNFILFVQQSLKNNVFRTI